MFITLMKLVGFGKLCLRRVLVKRGRNAVVGKSLNRVTIAFLANAAGSKKPSSIWKSGNPRCFMVSLKIVYQQDIFVR